MWINYQFIAVCPLILNVLHISPQKWLVFANYFGLPNFLPQLANFFTRIYPSYPWHFPTLSIPREGLMMNRMSVLHQNLGGNAKRRDVLENPFPWDPRYYRRGWISHSIIIYREGLNLTLSILSIGPLGHLGKSLGHRWWIQNTSRLNAVYGYSLSIRWGGFVLLS